MSKTAKRVLGIIVLTYVVVVFVYFLGWAVAENTGLEYRFWVDVLFRIIVWFVASSLVTVLCCCSVWQWAYLRDKAE